MDGAAVSRIERWTRQLLEAEARKRGIRDPEVRSRSELLWAMAQHDYGARQSLRNARKLVGSLIQGATQAWPKWSLWSHRGQAPQPEALPVDVPEIADAWLLTDEELAAERSNEALRAASRPGAGGRDSAGAAADADSADVAAGSTSAQLGAAVRASRLQLRRAAGQLELKWQVAEQDAARARVLLGQHGELSLRIVCVQADAAQVVRSSVTEHGPLDASGAWSWVLPGPEAHCVGSIGVRHGDRFVSIAHESSRVPLASFV
jgi:hypothetical protein